MRLSAIILTSNEEANIERCLNSLPAGIEVLIVDSGSTDGTAGIAEKRGARVLKRPLDNFGAQRNFGLKKAANDWVLFIDADEELAPELKAKLPAFIDNKEGVVGYDIRRWNYVLGKRMTHCWTPDHVLRLFDRRHARYKGEIHECAVADGKVVRVEEPILHYTFQSVSGYFDKINRYSTVEAGRLFKERAPFKPSMLVSRSWAMFTQVLLGRKGMLDGTRGLILALMEAALSYLTYAKLYELYEKEKNK
ncbi:MAG TPA: glycosyltransferase family 2 protein [Candidatus Omnitrophota bacterium]|nr:glycosyltransferase family 2 protein [Candidatus Omnitrophota bacterium]